jgi:serine/threonine-protein kinase
VLIVADTREPGLSFHPAARRVLRFGPFRTDLSDGSLWRGDEEVRMPPRALALLLYLLERPGRVIAKAELIDAVWKDANVSETSLTEALGIVRQTLGDSSQHPEYIQTVHRRGYRFIAPIAVDGPTTGPKAVTTAVDEETIPPDAARPPTPWRWRPGLVAIAAVAVVTVGGAALWSRNIQPEPPVTRASITLPATQAPPFSLSLYPIVALSPDGQEMVYVASSGNANQLYVRRMDQFDARAISGTEGAHAPFFSPDGKRVGFFARSKLKHVAVTGGDAVTVTDARGGLGGSWTPHGTIIFAPDWTGGLLEVDERGGAPRTLAASPGGGQGYRWPMILEDGETVIATRWKADQPTAAVVAISRSKGEETLLVRGGTSGSYVPDGTLVFARDGVLFAAPFTPGTPVGQERQVLDGVMTSLTGSAQYSVSKTGSLVYVPQDEKRNDRRLFQTDRDGAVRALPHDPRAFQEMSLCNDLIAVSILSRSGSDIWTGRLSGGALTQLTQTGSAMDPAWRPGCTELAYSSGNELYLRRADGSNAPVKLLDTDLVQAPSSWSPDGSRLVYVEVAPETRADVWVLNVASRQKERLLGSAAVEWFARVSPNGQWLAYQSSESGHYEVYLRRFGLDGGRVQLSSAGGAEPSWSADGRTVYFLQDRTRIVAVPIDPERGQPSAGSRVILSRPEMTMYLPLPDGKGFVIGDRIREHLPITTLNLVVNWAREIGR